MKNKLYLLLLFGFILFQACKKEGIQNQQPAKLIASLDWLETFSISNQVMNCTINASNNTVLAVVPESADFHHMTIGFTLANGVIATVNGATVTSGTTVDMSKLFYFKISSADGTQSSTFLINLQRELNYWGVPGTLISGKSLNRNYSYYFDQWAGTTSDNVNCGLAAATMAIKWADSTFTKTVVDARSMYLLTGEWSDRNVSDYMVYDGISHGVDSVLDETNIDSLIKTNIDNNRLMIFLADTYYLTYNAPGYEHVNSITKSSYPGLGHFFLVKGYKQTSQGFYAEVYDPNSDHGVYFPSPVFSEPVGQDRYIRSEEVKTATANWSNEVIIVAPKGEIALNVH